MMSSTCIKGIEPSYETERSYVLGGYIDLNPHCQFQNDQVIEKPYDFANINITLSIDIKTTWDKKGNNRCSSIFG